MVFQTLLNPVFSPLLKINPLLAIMLIAFLISLMIVLIYKKLTDQNLMKQLKAEIKELQAEMKSLKDKPQKMMEVQKKAMETNMKYMMHSFKPTLFTFIPIILIFGWLNANMGYYPIVQNTQFTITATFEDGTTGTIDIVDLPAGLTLLGDSQQQILANKAEWVMKGDAGTYTIEYQYNGQKFQHSLIITKDAAERTYAKPLLTAKELGVSSGLKQITISNKKVQPLKTIPLIGSIPWIGGFGWLGTYIIFSLIFSILLRKVLKVY